MIPVDSECYRECPEKKKIEKGGEKKIQGRGRDLAITIKLAQFLTDRARSVVPIDSEFYRECPEQKNSEKGVMGAI